MIVTEIPLAGVLLLEPVVHRDSRGFLCERFSLERYREAGIKDSFV